MKKAPFFTLLVPTKNRSHIIGYTIDSILQQTFHDYEIIISDNDDSDTATRDVIKRYYDDRIIYLRTSGDLSMSDNWENALSRAQGKYLMVLEDKQILYPYALSRINAIIQDSNPEALLWRSDILEQTKKGWSLRKYNGNGDLVIRTSDDILLDFVSNPDKVWDWLPRLINSCVDMNVVNRIREITRNHRLFNHVTPDLTSSFLQLSQVDSLIQVDEALSIIHSLRLSNAIDIRKKKKHHEKFFDDIKSENTGCEFVPIKSRYIVKNLIVNDYRYIKSMVGGRLKLYDVDDETYLHMCITDTAKSLVMGSDVTNEITAIRTYIKNMPFSVKVKSVMVFLSGIYRNGIRKLVFTLPFVTNMAHRTGKVKINSIYYGDDLDAAVNRILQG